MSSHGPPTHLHRSRGRVGFAVLIALALALVSSLLVGGARSASRASGVIAFTRANGIYVMREDGTGVRLLRRGGVAAGALGLAWSPDGRKLAFVYPFVADPGYGIWVMGADGTHLVSLYRPGEGQAFPGPPAWSPDGRKVAFALSWQEPGTSTWARDIWVVRADGTHLRRLAKTPGLWEGELDFSPNGRRIAVTTTGWGLRLYVLNADGSHPRALAPPGAGWFEATSPDWSPDGRRIAVSRWQSYPTTRHSIWVIDPRTHVGNRVLEAGIDPDPDTHPTWSPDGRKIAFVRGGEEWFNCSNCPTPRRDSSEIYVVNADGTGVTRLTHNTTGEGSPAWQPVGAPDHLGGR